MLLLNMVWPAIYIYAEVWRFWFLVFATIAIETFSIIAILKYPWTRALLASTIGNFVSGLVGSFVMMWAMILWHAVVDNFVPHATFDIINWIATYILMCLGSVFIETIAIKLIFKDTIKRLFTPLLIGNILTYAFIAYSMATKTDKDPEEKRRDQVSYISIPNKFNLLDTTELVIVSATVDVSYDKNDKILNQAFPLEITFRKENADDFQFELRLLGDEYAGGIGKDYKIIRLTELKDTIKIVLEQKNPDAGKGWTAPVITDTIDFVKQPKARQ